MISHSAVPGAGQFQGESLFSEEDRPRGQVMVDMIGQWLLGWFLELNTQNNQK